MSRLPTSVADIRELLAAGKLSQALTALKDWTKNDADMSNDVVQLSQRYATNEKNKNQDLIKHSDYLLERNKITNALLSILSEIKPDDANQYGEREIPRILTSPPFNPPVFIGREEDIAAIEKNYANDRRLLLLVNGEGGIGKTTLAAKFWLKHKDDYKHLGWLYADSGVGDALLSLAPKLGIRFDPQEEEAAKVARVVEAINNLPAPCLFVLDNANDAEDLDKNALTLGKLLNCHILITSRVGRLYGAPTLRVHPLQEKEAGVLFKTHYPKYSESEAPLLHSLLRAIGYNTLVVELLAKNLAAFNEFRRAYSLQNILSDLQQKGLFALQTKGVKITYQSAALRTEKPEHIISAMYDLAGLQEMEKRLLSNFAVLPAENIPYDRMVELLRPDDQDQFDETLKTLRQKGWIESAEAGLKISPIVQEIVKQKNKEALLEDCKTLADTLIKKLDREVIHEDNYQAAAIFSRYAESVVYVFKEPDLNIGVLCERIGSFHSTTGALDKALTFYEAFHRLAKELYAAYSDNVEFKNNLAVSYQYLGNTYSAMGYLDKALTFYEEFNQLEKELYPADPNNVDIKYGLAISYEKLGNTYTALGALDKALTFYEDFNRLEKELYVAFPNNVLFKNGLAVSYCFTGVTYAALGALDKALTFYEHYNQLEKELYSAYPNNVEFKNNLAISNQYLGNTHTALGALDKALIFYEDYNRLEKELNASYPHNVEFKNNLAISYQYLGDTHTALGALDKALTFYEDYNRLEKELYAAFPNNVLYKNALAISHCNLGKIHTALGALDKALTFYEDFNRLEKELYAAAPNNVEFKNALAISYCYMGITHTALDALDKALTFYENFNRLEKELYAAAPDNVSYKDGLALSCQYLGKTHSVLGALDQALTFFEEFNQLEKELYAAFPNNVSYKNSLAVSYVQLGYFYKGKKNDPAKARFYYELCEMLHAELAAAFPNYNEFQQRLKWVKNALSDM